MAIDPSIALSVKPVQIESPINQMAKAYEIQNAVQSNQLNKMKMDEYTRGLAEQEQFKNALAQANDENAIKNAFYSLGEKGVKGYSDYIKTQQETSNLKLTGQKTSGDILKTKQEFTSQALRNISTNPSDENIIAWGQDAVLKGISTEAEVKQTVDHLLAVPAAQRPAYLASQGASASDLKPHIQTQNLGGTSQIVAVPAFGGAPTTLSTSKMTATPGELLTAQTTREGQAITKRGQDLTDARELQRIAIEKGKTSPDYIALEAKMKQQGKQAAIDAVAVPAAIDSATQAISKIDELVGKPTLKDKSGKIIQQGTAPHPGFEQAVGAGVPGLKYVPGTSAADFNARLNEIQGGAFLEAYNTLKGGGSITEVEGQKATQAITRMSTAQSEAEFKTAARDFQDVLRKGIDRAKAKVGNAGGADVDTTNPLLK